MRYQAIGVPKNERIEARSHRERIERAPVAARASSARAVGEI